MNKKSLIVAGSIITALTLSGCGTNKSALNKKNTGYENVNYRNQPNYPYTAKHQYPNNMEYVSFGKDYGRNIHFGNNRINEGLKSEYYNDGMVRNVNNRGKNAMNYNDQYLNTQQVRYNTNTVLDHSDNTPIVPFTNISTNTTMTNGEKMYSDQLALRVRQMPNVSNANVITVGNEVLVGVDLTDKNVNESDMRSKIKNTLSPYTSGKNVHVTFDNNIKNKMMNITNSNIGQDIKNMGTDVKDNLRNVKNDVKNNVKNMTR